MRKKKTELQKLRDRADGQLTPHICQKHPRCLLCSMPSQVAHHYFKKSESNRLRYWEDNLIPLCHRCHFSLHQHETDYAGRIINIKGLDWHNDLVKKKQEYQKVDKLFYQKAIEEYENKTLLT